MKPGQIKIIGVDCAVQSKRVGLAVGLIENDQVRLIYPKAGSATKWLGAGALEIVQWMTGDDPVLFAFDAPLGWPVPLAASLAGHQAGEQIHQTPDDMFHRHTDRRIQERLKVRPLEVAADRIARTAHAALALLNMVRRQSGLPIPLAWNPGELTQAQVIEVYPAGTLRSHGLPHNGYKDQAPGAVLRRQQIITALHERIEMPAETMILEKNADVLDAVVCVLAGVDFLTGLALGPQESELDAARKEGWIWVRSPVQ